MLSLKASDIDTAVAGVEDGGKRRIYQVAYISGLIL